MRLRSRMVGAIAGGLLALLAPLQAVPASAAPTPGFYDQVPLNLARLKSGALIASEKETDFPRPFDHASVAYRIVYRSTG